MESLFGKNSGGVRILSQAESEKASLGVLEFLERGVAMVAEPCLELFGAVTEERVARQWMPARSHQHSLTRIHKRVSSWPVNPHDFLVFFSNNLRNGERR